MKKTTKKGRPRCAPGTDRQAGMLRIRMSEDEAADLAAAAQGMGLLAATWARMKLLEAKLEDGKTAMETLTGGREHMFRVSLSLDERAKVDTLAAAAEMPTSTWARSVLLSVANPRK